MLSNQNFNPLPIIGVGPELFYDPHGVNKVDMEVISLFRRKLLPFAFFQFAYFSVSQSPLFGDQYQFFNVLTGFGLKFIFSVIVDLSKLHEVNGAKKAANVIDLVYSPEFSAKITLPTEVLVTARKSDLLDTMRIFQEELIPYTPQNFIFTFQQKWNQGIQKYDFLQHS